jgi:hypothetical protein
MRFFKKIIVPLFVIFAIAGCREKYVPTLKEPATGYLVVDGFINSGPGPTTITLSRTTKLSTGQIQYETRATVSVVGKLNTTAFNLPETATKGIYSIAQLNLNPADQYRLRITTVAGREYLSDFSSVRRTPAIDSISWAEESDGVHLYGNTHGTQEPVGYYQWKFDETWEIHSSFITRLKVYYDAFGVADHVGYRDSATRSDDFSIFFCWRNDTSKNILVTSTQALTKNVVANFPLRIIRTNAEELSVRYSINAKVYSISKENMKFLEQLRKNTELLGSIFDAQPSESTGNIHAVNNPSEVVVGFVEVTEEKVRRTFIAQTQLQNWRYNSGCPREDNIRNGPPLLISTSEMPTQVSKWNEAHPQLMDSVYTAPTICVDCTLRGYNKKPSFW